jgi:hypothetical protein
MIELGGLLTTILELVFAGLLLFVPWVTTKVLSWVRLDSDAKIRALIEEGLKNALAYAKSQMAERLKPGLSIEVKNELLATAAGYAVSHIPDALEHFGITPELLHEKLEARLRKEEPHV